LDRADWHWRRRRCRNWSSRQIGNRYGQQFRGWCRAHVSTEATPLVQAPPTENLIRVDSVCPPTRATDDLGWKLSSTIRRFSAIEYLRRLGVFGASATTDSIVTRAELPIRSSRMTCCPRQI